MVRKHKNITVIIKTIYLIVAKYYKNIKNPHFKYLITGKPVYVTTFLSITKPIQ